MVNIFGRFMDKVEIKEFSLFFREAELSGYLKLDNKNSVYTIREGWVIGIAANCYDFH